MNTPLYAVPDHVLEESVGGDIVLLSLKRETFYSLNSTGRILWAVIKDSGEVSGLADRLVEAYGITFEQAQSDVQAFIDDLKRNELIFPL